MASIRQTLNASIAGKVREVIENGKRWLVAPAAILIQGVLNGSKGALFYPDDENKRTAHLWDGIPITVNHPFDPITNEPLDSADQRVIDNQHIGETRNPVHDGKTRVEMWFDAEATRNKAPQVYQSLMKNEQIAVSTGLYTNNVPKQGVFNNIPYVAEARDHKPDHLAVLPNQRGACHITDGCGVNVTNAFDDLPRDAQKAAFSKMESDLKDAAKEHSESLRKHEHLSGVATRLSSGRMKLKEAINQIKVYPEHENAKTKEHVLSAAKQAKEEHLNAVEKLARVHDVLRKNTPTSNACSCGGTCEKCRTENTWSDAAREAALEARRASAKAKESGDKNDHREAALRHFHAAEQFRKEAAKFPGQPEKSEPHTKAALEHQSEGQRHVSTIAGKDITGTGKYPPIQNAEPSDRIDSDKACQILHDGTAQGHPLTDDQRKMFGAACGEATKNSFWSWLGNALGITSNTPQHPGSGKFIAPKDVLHAHAGHEYRKTLEGDACPDCGGWMSGGKCQVCGYTKGSEEKAETTPTGGWSMNSDPSFNSWTSNVWSDEARQAAAEARAAGAKATKSGEGEHHREAVTAHLKAAYHASKDNDHETAAHHYEQANVHSAAAQRTHNSTDWAELVGNKDYPWEDCIADQHKAGHDDESAKKICGTIKAANNTANNQAGDINMAMTANEKKAIVDALVSNCSCADANVWEESDRAALNALPEPKLLRLKAQRDAAVKNEMDDSSYVEDEEDENMKRMRGKKTQNAAPAMSPEGLVLALNQLDKINRLTQHVTDPEKRKTLVANLYTKSADELDLMIELQGPPRVQVMNNAQPYLPNFLGAGGGNGSTVNNAADSGDAEDIIPTTNIDWQEIARERAKSGNVKAINAN